MKKSTVLLWIVILTFTATGCCDSGFGLYQSEGDISNVRIDYGESELYTKEDMDAAIREIKNRFRSWKGFEMYSITYMSDTECSEANIRWMNELETANDAKEHFTQCIAFKSDFHTAKNNEGFEEDTDYTNWM